MHVPNYQINKVVICLGSNVEARSECVNVALEWLRNILTDVMASQCYQTDDIKGSGRVYANMVVCGMTELTYSELEQSLKKHEMESGRTAEARKNGDVPLDMDIVIWNDSVIRHKDVSCDFFIIGASQIGCMPVNSETDKLMITK